MISAIRSDIVGLGDSNVAHASNNEGHITLGNGNDFAANAMSVSLFALGGPAQGGDRLFTNNVTGPADELSNRGRK